MPGQPAASQEPQQEQKIPAVMSPPATETALAPRGFDRIIELAITKKVPMDTLERLLVMQREIMAANAKAQYDEALAAFQSECPVIEKRKKVYNKDGVTIRYKYAPMDDIIAQVKDLLAKHGFSYDIGQTILNNTLTVFCTLTHVGGRSNTKELALPIGKSGHMTDQQEVAAARTFGARYCFVGVAGIMTGDEDVDGAALPTKTQEDQAPRSKVPPTNGGGRAGAAGESPGKTAPPAPILLGEEGTYTTQILTLELSSNKQSHTITTAAGLRFYINLKSDKTIAARAAIEDKRPWEIAWKASKHQDRVYYWVRSITNPYDQRPESEIVSKEQRSEENLDKLFGPKASEQPPTTPPAATTQTTPAPATPAAEAAPLFDKRPARSDPQAGLTSVGQMVLVTATQKFGDFKILEMVDVQYGGVNCCWIKCADNHDFYSPTKEYIDKAVECFNKGWSACIVARKTDFGWLIEAIQGRQSSS